jgi:hypothetical protein
MTEQSPKKKHSRTEIIDGKEYKVTTLPSEALLSEEALRKAGKVLPEPVYVVPEYDKRRQELYDAQAKALDGTDDNEHMQRIAEQRAKNESSWAKSLREGVYRKSDGDRGRS